MLVFRRNISSFFSWLEEEDYILKSPMKRTHKIKTKTVVKNVITDEVIEKLRDNCLEIRYLNRSAQFEKVKNNSIKKNV